MCSEQSEFVAVYGRRRVGKTFLIRYVLERHFSIYVTGLPGGSYREQINNFCMAIMQGFNVDYKECETKEYDNLYRSMFKNYSSHIKVVEALATKSMGMTKKDLCEKTGMPESGSTTTVLQELVDCGILNEYNQVGKKAKGKMYQLVDFFTLFYLRFVKKIQGEENFWTKNLNTPTVNTWAGYAFEQVCFAHLPQIKKTLGIAGISTKVSSWKSSDKENGAQIDMVIERSDKVINICEIKYAGSQYTITSDYANKLRNKLVSFKEETKTKSALHLTMITTYGLKKNSENSSMAQSEVTSDCLFEE